MGNFFNSFKNGVSSLLRDKKNLISLLILGIIILSLPIGIKLLQEQRIIKSKAVNPAIVVKDLEGNALPEKDGIPYTPSTSVQLEITSPLGPASPVGEKIAPSSKASLSKTSGFQNGETVTITFTATDTGGSGMRSIHTNLLSGVTSEEDAKDAAHIAAWSAPAAYQGFDMRSGATTFTRTATVPFYLEYSAEDMAYNKETANKLPVKEGTVVSFKDAKPKGLLSFLPSLVKPAYADEYDAPGCTPGAVGVACITQKCPNTQTACAAGHLYCVYDSKGNYWGSAQIRGKCSEEVNNCATQCVASPTGGQTTPAGSCSADVETVRKGLVAAGGSSFQNATCQAITDELCKNCSLFPPPNTIRTALCPNSCGSATGACTVSWALPDTAPLPNTNFTVKIKGDNDPGGWQNIDLLIDGNKNGITGKPIESPYPTFVYEVNSGIAGKHTLSFTVDKENRTCIPTKEFSTSVPSIEGFVHSDTGAAVVGATVGIGVVRAEGVTVGSVQTDDNGHFIYSASGLVLGDGYYVRVKNVPGSYNLASVKVDSNGSSTYEANGQTFITNTYYQPGCAGAGTSGSDTPITSSSYECQKLGENDCASLGGTINPQKGRCSFKVFSAPAATTVAFRIAENSNFLKDDGKTEIGWETYTNHPTVMQYTFNSAAAGSKFIFVQFKDSNGKIGCDDNKPYCSVQVKLLGDAPSIANCSLSFKNSETLITLSGEKFGATKGSAKSGEQDLTIKKWKDDEVQITWSGAPEGEALPIVLTSVDGQTGEIVCSATSQLSLGAKVFCRQPSLHQTSNVDITLVGAYKGGIKVKQKVSIDKDGVVTGLNQKLEAGKNYLLSIKAPKSLRRNIFFTAGEGTTNLSSLNLVLPVGDIFPVDGGDGRINVYDHNELVREWIISSDATNRLGDFNQDSRVNSIDWACMRVSMPESARSSDEPEPEPGEQDKIYCGGISGVRCPAEFTCRYEGNYPDASGYCIAEATSTPAPTATAVPEVSPTASSSIKPSPTATASPVPSASSSVDTAPPVTTYNLDPASGFENNDYVTITFTATDTGGSGVKYIHTAAVSNVSTEQEAKSDPAKWSAGYKGFRIDRGEVAKIKVTVPSYIEYRAEDIKGNLAVVKKLFLLPTRVRTE